MHAIRDSMRDVMLCVVVVMCQVKLQEYEKPVQVQVWDTAGQERFRILTTVCHIVLLASYINQMYALP